MTRALSAKGLEYTYHNGNKALKEVSFCVEKGSFTVLLGPNGAGKSTFFRWQVP